MLIDQSKRLVFFHNPKAAGTSLAAYLGFDTSAGRRFIHMTCDEAKEWIFQDTWNDYFKFAIVRNPWDRMVSLYTFQRSVGYAMFLNLNPSHRLARTYDFDEWLILNDQGTIQSNWFRTPQTRWCKDVDHVGQMEDIGVTVTMLQDRFDMAGSKLSKRNSSDRNGSYRDFFKDQQSIDIVANIDRETIDAYGYDF